jgi:hypothetical protein
VQGRTDSLAVVPERKREVGRYGREWAAQS